MARPDAAGTGRTTGMYLVQHDHACHATQDCHSPPPRRSRRCLLALLAPGSSKAAASGPAQPAGPHRQQPWLLPQLTCQETSGQRQLRWQALPGHRPCQRCGRQHPWPVHTLQRCPCAQHCLPSRCVAGLLLGRRACCPGWRWSHLCPLSGRGPHPGRCCQRLTVACLLMASGASCGLLLLLLRPLLASSRVRRAVG